MSGTWTTRHTAWVSVLEGDRTNSLCNFVSRLKPIYYIYNLRGVAKLCFDWSPLTSSRILHTSLSSTTSCELSERDVTSHLKPTAGCQILTLIFDFILWRGCLFTYPIKCLGGFLHLKPTPGCQISTLIFDFFLMEGVSLNIPWKIY
jgi:hypothetical protein